MPYLNLNLPIAPSSDVSAKAAQVLTQLTADLLGKKPELTAVAITATPRDAWYIGGRALPAGQSSFYLDIKVTEGTNTKNEKARYVEAVFDAMTALLGELAPASYVVIDEVRADAWGYSGQTQEYRYIRGKPL
ncbi:MAG: tautomerase family protein [Burkholderiaceae bacterium]|nr:tautomerase family protein [Rhodoferax sp.]MCW5642074.1 tautomerase family protein [Rhodoferax sp.]